MSNGGDHLVELNFRLSAIGHVPHYGYSAGEFIIANDGDHARIPTVGIFHLGL